MYLLNFACEELTDFACFFQDNLIYNSMQGPASTIFSSDNLFSLDRAEKRFLYYSIFNEDIIARGQRGLGI